MRPIGLHLRLDGSLKSLSDRALSLQLPFFQCFLILKATGALVAVSQEEKEAFLAIRDRFSHLYLHASYWVNLADSTIERHSALHREMQLASQLQFTHVVIHPGSIGKGRIKSEGIAAVARAINGLHKNNTRLKIILENGAHGPNSVGSDITDFGFLLPQLNFPERIQFCIDTAHAHAHGYDIINQHAREQFIQLVDETIGIANIALLHVNDTNESRGSYRDKHASLGQGLLGEQVLKDFCLHEKLKDIPLLLELPVMPQDQEEEIINRVRAWHE